MLKKAHLLGLLSVAALGTISLPASADQVNTQITEQDAAAVGDYNQIRQNSEQYNLQKREGYSRRGSLTQQDSLQQTRQSAGAVGSDNSIRQDSRQYNEQREKAPKFNPRAYKGVTDHHPSYYR